MSDLSFSSRAAATRQARGAAGTHDLADPLGGDHIGPGRDHLGVDPLGAAPVQRDGGEGTVDPDTVRAAAHEGTRGSGSSLPHLDRIQTAFGKHDVGGVTAHVGGAAADATRAMGARAYAQGDHVAFGSAPDLHTAAHEAAHVMQQSRGVQLEGGVGAVGDVYERHADAVADAVVAGRSAEGLIDAAPAGASSAGVQMLAVDDDPLDFSGATTLKRSGDGIAGVYFLTEGSDTVVVKPESGTDKMVDANAILTQAGIGVPKMKVFDKSDGPAKSAISAMSGLAGQLSEKHQEQLPLQVDGASKIVVMGMVKGTSMKSMDRSKLKEAVLDPEVLSELGRIILVDAIMGNTDRLYGGRLNLGNVMMGEDKKVTAVDSDYKPSEKRKYDISRVKDIIEPTKQAQWINMIVISVSKFFTGENALTELETEMMKIGLKKGIDDNVLEVVGALRDGVEGLTGDDETVKSKQDQIKEVSKYMESRFRRDRLPTGLKWVGRLRASTGL